MLPTQPAANKYRIEGIVRKRYKQNKEHLDLSTMRLDLGLIREWANVLQSRDWSSLKSITLSRSALSQVAYKMVIMR